MAQYKFARPKTTVKQILKEAGDQAMFPVVDENNVFQGSILKKDLDNKPDNKTAGEILKEVLSGEEDVRRRVYVPGPTPLKDALSIMINAGLPFIPVVDNNLRYKGTIALNL
jgi:CBS domain-containing protein